MENRKTYSVERWENRNRYKKPMRNLKVIQSNNGKIGTDIKPMRNLKVVQSNNGGVAPFEDCDAVGRVAA